MHKILKFPVIFGCFIFLLCGSLCTASGAGEASQGRKVFSSADLSQRVEAAMEARKSRDPAAIGEASRKVIALALAELAKLRLDKRAYNDAIELCGESLLFEDTAETRVEIAIASLYAKKPAEAVKQAASASEMDPQNALAWTIKGEALLRSEDYAGAAGALGHALGVKRDSESLYALGTAQLGMGEKQKAAETLSQFLALVGDSGWSRVLVGRAYQEQALLAEAETEFQNALRLDPATPNAHYFWALNSMRRNAWNPNAEVYSHLRAELQLNPRHFEANYMMGSLASTARNYRESDQYLHLASEVKPPVPETWVLLGVNAQSRKANQTAEAFFRKAIELTKNLDPKEHFEIRKAYIGLSRLLMASGRIEEGKELIARAQELQAQSLIEARKRSSGAKDKEDAEETGASAPYIPESDSDQEHSLSSLSEKSLTARVDSSSAQRAAIHSPYGPQGKTERRLRVVLGVSFNDLATADAFQEKYQQAFNHYREAARWDPQIPGLERNLGLAAYFVADTAEAIRLLRKVVNAAPHDDHARAVLALSYFAREDFAKTAQTIAPIAHRALQDLQLGYALAKSLAETGNKSGASRALQSLEKADANLTAESLTQFGQLWQQLGDTERAAESFRRAQDLSSRKVP